MMLCGQEMKVLLVGIILGAAVQYVSSDKQPFCENMKKFFPPENESLAFILDPPGTLEFACRDGFASMSCCMYGQSQITWEQCKHHYKDEPCSWYPLMLENIDSRYLEEKNQTFIIERVEEMRDVGFYRCTGAGGSPQQTITNMIHLKIEDCSVSMPLTFVQPMKKNTTMRVTLGTSVPLECAVLAVGDPDSQCDGQCLTWYKRQVYKNHTLGLPVEITGERIQTYQKRDSKNFVLSSLNIHEIQEDDLDWMYVCDTFSDDHGADKRRMFHLKIVEENIQPIAQWIVLTAIASVTVVVVFVSLMYRYNVEIQVCYRTKVRRQTTLQDREYHVFLLHTNESREDRTFSLQVLRPYLLEKLRYRVFSENDINFGEDFLDRFAEGVENSCVLVVVVSKELFQDEPCKMCIRDAITLGRNIIFVVRESPNDEMESARDILAALRSGVKIKWPREDDVEITSTTGYLGCSSNSVNQPCRAVQDPSHCKNKLQLHLLKYLQDKSRRDTNCVCLNSDSMNNMEHHPIVSQSLNSINV